MKHWVVIINGAYGNHRRAKLMLIKRYKSEKVTESKKVEIIECGIQEINYEDYP